MHSISIDIMGPKNGRKFLLGVRSESDSQFNNDSGLCFRKCRNGNNADYAGFNILGSCFNETLSMTDRQTDTQSNTSSYLSQKLSSS